MENYAGFQYFRSVLVSKTDFISRFLFFFTAFPSWKGSERFEGLSLFHFSVLCYFGCLSTNYVWKIAEKPVRGWFDAVHKYSSYLLGALSGGGFCQASSAACLLLTS